MKRLELKVALVPLALALFSCAQGDRADELVTADIGILNGNIDTLNTRMEAVGITVGCSGALLTNTWVLTANHCWTDGRPLTVTYGNQTRTSSAIFRGPGNANFVPGGKPTEHQGMDVLLISLGVHPFNINGSYSGYARSLFPLDSTALEGQTVEVDGWGVIDTASDPSANLRWASLPVEQTGVEKDHINSDGLDVGDLVTYDNTNQANPIAGQFPLGGDSGGGVFASMFGVTYLAAVHAGGDDYATLKRAFGTSTAHQTVRGWVDATMFGSPLTLNYSLYSNPCISSHLNGANDIFWVDNNKHLIYNPGALGLVDLGTPPGVTLGGNKPASVSMSYGRVDVFVQTTSNQLFSRTLSSGAWGDWVELTGGLAVTSSPAVSSWGANRMDLFARGASGELRHSYYDGSWHLIWEPLGFWNLTGSPTAVSWGSNRIDVFFRSTDNAIHQLTFDGNGSGWLNLGNIGGSTSNSPAVSSSKSGRLDVWAQAAVNGHLLHRWYEGTWVSGWIDAGFTVPSGLSAASVAPGRVLMVSNSAGSLWQAGY